MKKEGDPKLYLLAVSSSIPDHNKHCVRSKYCIFDAGTLRDAMASIAVSAYRSGNLQDGYG